VSESDAALLGKLRAYHGGDSLPKSIDVWGSDVFQHVMGTH
jgi:hypothetical protein